MLKICSVGVLALLLICSCNPLTENHSDDITINKIPPSCISKLAPCEIKNAADNFAIFFDVERVLTEQPFNILLRHQGQNRIAKIAGFLAGKEMFMGKIPLFFTLDNTLEMYTAQTLLGMCTESAMVWQMTIMVEYVAQAGIKPVVQTLLFEFSSTNN